MKHADDPFAAYNAFCLTEPLKNHECSVPISKNANDWWGKQTLILKYLFSKNRYTNISGPGNLYK